MTDSELDLAIAEIIIPQEKPKSTKNSYFRKCFDKRRLNKMISPRKLKNVAEDFYKRFIRLGMSDNDYILKDSDMFIRGVYKYPCCKYNSLTGRLKKSLSKKAVRIRRLMKRIRRRQPRKIKSEIADGSAYKKIHMTHI